MISDGLSILGDQLRSERGQHFVEEAGGLSGGGYCGIPIDERGQLTMRGDVLVGKNGLDAAGRADAGKGILHVNLLRQRDAIAEFGQEFLV